MTLITMITTTIVLESNNYCFETVKGQLGNAYSIIAGPSYAGATLEESLGV